VFCQYPPGQKFFAYGERPWAQAIADPASAATIILIVVFVASLALGLLFLLGTRRQTIKSAAEKETQLPAPPPASREQVGGAMPASDTMGAGVSPIFKSFDNAINYFFNGLIFLYKWAFNYNVRPAPPRAQPELPQLLPARLSVTIPSTIQNRPPAILPPPAINPPSNSRPYGLQALIDIMGEGIEAALAGLAYGIVFIFEAFINVFKWIFRIDR
jgi:hypothetical protein